MDINAQIKITDEKEVSNFLQAKLKAEIFDKTRFNDKSFCKYAILEYCKMLLKESGMDE